MHRVILETLDLSKVGKRIIFEFFLPRLLDKDSELEVSDHMIRRHLVSIGDSKMSTQEISRNMATLMRARILTRLPGRYTGMFVYRWHERLF